MIIKAGATGISLYFEVLDSSSTSGARRTGLAYNTAGLTAYYARTRGAATAITLASLASPTAAWSSGGFVEVDATNMPGLYRLDVPDAAFASGATSVAIVLRGAANMAQVSKEIRLVAYDPDNATSLGLANIDVATSTLLAAASYTAPDNAGIAAIKAKTDKLSFDASNRVSSKVDAMAADVLTASVLATDAAQEIADAVKSRTLTVSYRSPGVAPTLEQAVYELLSHLGYAANVGAQKQLKSAIDGTTVVQVYDYDNADAPTSITRSS
jgi:hypothetical protein